MVTAGDFRNGVTFEMDGGVYSIIEFQHVKPGKGAAFVRTKIRNVITGAVTEKTFNPSDKYPTAYIERKDMQYLYSDGDLVLLHGQRDLRADPHQRQRPGRQLQVCQGEHGLQGALLQGQRVRRGASQLCGAGSHQDRARLCAATPLPTP